MDNVLEVGDCLVAYSYRNGVWIDNNYKLIVTRITKTQAEASNGVAKIKVNLQGKRYGGEFFRFDPVGERNRYGITYHKKCDAIVALIDKQRVRRELETKYRPAKTRLLEVLEDRMPDDATMTKIINFIQELEK